MNFQAIQQIKGQKDGNYPKRLDMYAVLNELKGTYFNANKTACHDCVITDTTGEKHKVTLYKDAPAVNLLGTQQVFSLYAYDGTFTDKSTGQQKSYTGYSGFWVANPQRHQQSSQNAPRNPPQRPQQAAQAANAPPGIDTQSQILAMAERFLSAIEALIYPNANTTDRPTQPSGPNPDYVGDNPSPPQDDSIPF